MRHDLIRQDIEAADVGELVRTGRDDLVLQQLVETIAGYVERYEGEPSIDDVTQALQGWPMQTHYYTNEGVEVTAQDAWGYMQEVRS